MRKFKTGFFKDAKGNVHHFRKVVDRTPSIISEAISGEEDVCSYYAMPENLVFLSRRCDSKAVRNALAEKAA